MSFSLQKAKEIKHTIVKVNKINNKLFFFEAKNILIPSKIILTQNIKSIKIINYPISCIGDIEAHYATDFYYYNDTKSDRVDWYYAYLDYNWEKETIELINKTIDLI